LTWFVVYTYPMQLI